MKPVYAVADNIVSPIGSNSSINIDRVAGGLSGIRLISNTGLSALPFYASAFQNYNDLDADKNFTRFEALCIASINNALTQTEISLADQETIFILSTTKGNIELIEHHTVDDKLKDRLSLFKTANVIANHFHSPNAPLVVSNACISGVLAIVYAKRLLETGKYKHAVITGADIISRFIVSGFQCLSAMSDKPCKPFDKSRNGINLGECAATMVISTVPSVTNGIKTEVNHGAITNDANHISGPSRTGKELSFAIDTAMKNTGITPEQVSFISAHGTATVYNDEMEAKAFNMSGFSEVPLNSLKGNYGHTLGAAGVLESILTYRSLQKGIILPSKNFEESDAPGKVTVNTTVKKSEKKYALKTASGFGGCNAAIIYSIS